MNTENKAKEIKSRINQLIEEKAASLAEIQVEIDKAVERETAAAADMKAATESTNVEAYQTAKAAKLAASNALEMYHARFQQLTEREFLTEAESDEVIDELLEYEDKLQEDFLKSLEAPLKKLNSLYEEYTARVKETEETISRWTNEIHANFRNFYAMYADGSNRAKTPQRVHNIPVTGCPASEITGKYLRSMTHHVPQLEK